MNPRRALGGVRPVHLHDELPDLALDRRPAWRARSALPAPVEAKATPMLAKDGLRLDDDQSSTPFGPDAREPCPEDPIALCQLDPPPPELASKDEHLVTQGQHLSL